MTIWSQRVDLIVYNHEINVWVSFLLVWFHFFIKGSEFFVILVQSVYERGPQDPLPVFEVWETAQHEGGGS